MGQPERITPAERLSEVARLLGEGARLLLQKRAAAAADEERQDQATEPAKADANSRS